MYGYEPDEVAREAGAFNSVEPCSVNRGLVLEHTEFFEYHRFVVEAR